MQTSIAVFCCSFVSQMLGYIINVITVCQLVIQTQNIFIYAALCWLETSSDEADMGLLLKSNYSLTAIKHNKFFTYYLVIFGNLQFSH